MTVRYCNKNGHLAFYRIHLKNPTRRAQTEGTVIKESRENEANQSGSGKVTGGARISDGNERND